MKISYNWLKWYIPEIPEPEKLADVFTYHLCEVDGMETWQDDTIFDLNILPNRAHDLLSHKGVAKELSGLLQITFIDPTPKYKIPESKETSLKINIENEKCRRYSARIIRGVKVGPSPEWVVKHLESIGQRSINNVVDATNLTMFDCGQPTHAFDFEKIKGPITIRNAKAGEKINILGGEEKELVETDMVIADDEGALAIAGVKGGTKAEVDENTKDVIIEVANFDPVSVRKTAKRLGIFTDSTKRFENDLSPVYVTPAMVELSALFVEMFPEAVFEEIVDEYPTRETFEKKKMVVVSQKDINRILGTNFDVATITTAVLSLGFDYSETDGIFQVFVPLERLDLNLTQDLVEEVARVIGYEKVAPVMPEIFKKPKINETFAKVFAVRKKLLEEGYSEVMTYTFVKKGKVEVARGVKGKSHLRTNISDGIKESFEMNRLNTGVLGMDEIKIFEIGTVFPEADKEIIHVAVADKKIKEMTIDEYVKENNLDISEYEISENLEKENKHFKQWSGFPFIVRDVAVLLPNETDKKELEDILEKRNFLHVNRDLWMCIKKIIKLLMHIDLFFNPTKKLSQTMRSHR
ncbi:MAG: phenylalanine--tRNA ligase subunit beta [Candidatus Paceibacterota bacterium]